MEVTVTPMSRSRPPKTQWAVDGGQLAAPLNITTFHFFREAQGSPPKADQVTGRAFFWFVSLGRAKKMNKQDLWVLSLTSLSMLLVATFQKRSYLYKLSE
jgi:hypothetical protein